MRTTLGRTELQDYVGGQLDHFFPDGSPATRRSLAEAVSEALVRMEHCFSRIGKKYFQVDGRPRFNHLHSDQYAMFLYLAGNAEYRANGHTPLAEKLFLLNKALHGVDAFYAIELPPVFLFCHPVGTVIGNARYGDYFAVYQNCTIGSTGPDAYPTFGDGVVLFANATVIGGCDVGDDVTFGAGSFVLGTDVPARSMVAGRYPDHRVRADHPGSRLQVFGPACH